MYQEYREEFLKKEKFDSEKELVETLMTLTIDRLWKGHKEKIEDYSWEKDQGGADCCVVRLKDEYTPGYASPLLDRIIFRVVVY